VSGTTVDELFVAAKARARWRSAMTAIGIARTSGGAVNIGPTHSGRSSSSFVLTRGLDRRLQLWRHRNSCHCSWVVGPCTESLRRRRHDGEAGMRIRDWGQDRKSRSYPRKTWSVGGVMGRLRLVADGQAEQGSNADRLHGIQVEQKDSVPGKRRCGESN
jgi:hypothetical protein